MNTLLNQKKMLTSELTNKKIEFECTKAISTAMPDNRTKVHSFWASTKPIEGIPDVKDYHETMERVCLLPVGAVDLDITHLDEDCLSGSKEIPETALIH